MTTCAEYATRLGEAETALHKLSIGSAVETIQDGAERLTYKATDMAKLQAYVTWLQGKVNACNGTPTRRRIIQFIPE
jgi:gpW